MAARRIVLQVAIALAVVGVISHFTLGDTFAACSATGEEK